MTDIPKLAPRPEVVEFLRSRRSRPPQALGPEGPSRAELETILEMAVRVPDHGKVQPWRLIMIGGAARGAVAEVIEKRGVALGIDPQRAAKAGQAWREGAVTAVVVHAPRPGADIPLREQLLSAGCVALSLVNACLASGWGASWLTGFAATDKEIQRGLGVTGEEEIVGFVHIGSEKTVPPERPRPDLGEITRWIAL